MLSWFRAIMPKEEQFFALFNAHAATLVKGGEALRELLEGGEGIEASCQKIMDHEHAADEIGREVLLAVRRTFITPFDRSDIRGLAVSLDDSIDQMQKTAKAIRLFEVRTFEPQMRELGDIIVEAAGLTQEAVSLLPTMNKDKARLNALTEKIVQLENRSDAVYDDGLKALFQASGSDAMRFVVGSEIYEHLEKVVDRFEDVANRISGILIEHL